MLGKLYQAIPELKDGSGFQKTTLAALHAAVGSVKPLAGMNSAVYESFRESHSRCCLKDRLDQQPQLQMPCMIRCCREELEIYDLNRDRAKGITPLQAQTLYQLNDRWQSVHNSSSFSK